MKASSRHILLIDYLRGVAIISIFLYHCLGLAYGVTSLPWEWLRRGFSAPASFIALLPVHFGFLGVPMFFVISGFCIHLSFNQQGQEWISFFIRRFFRIYPAYLLTFILLLPFYARDFREAWFQFKYHALLIHNFNPATEWGVNGALWTIAVEVQLYLVYPLLLWSVGRFGWTRTLTALAACEIFLDLWDDALYQLTAYSGYNIFSPSLLWKVSPIVDHFIRPSPLGYWFSWSLGAYAANAFIQGRQLPLAKSSMSFWVFLIVVSYFTVLLAPFSFLLYALLTTKIISKCLASAGELSQEPNLWLRLLRRTGLYSYSIYLIHLPLLESLAGFLREANPRFWQFLIFSLCVISWLVVMPLAGLCYRFIEQPGIVFGKQIIQKMAQNKKISPQGNPASASSKEKIES
ncbi:MAG TPA: acyltransferase [Verrucomicrobiae bacterium]|nr:acyltransferase [Verrucomicrobiae bacterium]